MRKWKGIMLLLALITSACLLAGCAANPIKNDSEESSVAETSEEEIITPIPTETPESVITPEPVVPQEDIPEGMAKIDFFGKKFPDDHGNSSGFSCTACGSYHSRIYKCICEKLVHISCMLIVVHSGGRNGVSFSSKSLFSCNCWEKTKIKNFFDFTRH